MYKSKINTIFIFIGLGLLMVIFVNPEFANDTTNKVLHTFIETEKIPSENQTNNTTQSLIPSKTLFYLNTIKVRPSTKKDIPIQKNNDNKEITLSTDTIVDATNRERIKANLLPLKLNSHLVASAKLKTEDMITKQYFEHVSPTGEGISDISEKVGYRYIVLGENLALGDFKDSNDVVTAWMNSPGHRANILNTTYQEIGIYAAKGVYQNREVWFVVQHFGTERSACPSINTQLKLSIDTINTDLKQRQAQIANEKAFLEGHTRPEGEEYKVKVIAFNKLIIEYNATLAISQEKIKQYNIQVTTFNSCLSKFQLKQ